MTNFTLANRRNAQLIEMRTRLLYAAAVAYQKNPSMDRLAELNRVVEITRDVVHDEVSDHGGQMWSRELVARS